VSSWVWIDPAVVSAIHDEQIAEHGGAVGVRDQGLLESALARPQNRAAYGEADAHVLAAAYAFGVAKNHPFVDGNKRTALVLCELFLELNGWRNAAGDAETLAAVLDLASGDLDEEGFAAWLRDSCVGL
jgi:death-on-curing protein